MLDAIWLIFTCTKEKGDSGRVTKENRSGMGDAVSSQEEDQPQEDLGWEPLQGVRSRSAVCIGTGLIC